jgi:hypothetical protein
VRAGIAAVEALAEDLGDAVGGGAMEEMLLIRLNLREKNGHQRGESWRKNISGPSRFRTFESDRKLL